jgi:hypothetical protein
MNVLDSHISVGGKINVGIISVDYTNCLVKMKLTWVQDPKSSFKF